MNFINSLCHVHGQWAGQPFNLMGWQEKIVRDIFGTVKADGYRQYNTAFVFTPKKNAKSELATAIALYLLCADGEYGAEIYGYAADKNQASIIFKTASQMVSDNLQSLCRTCHNKKTAIERAKRNSKFL